MSEKVIRNCPKCLSTQERIKNLESMLDGKVKDHGDLCVELSDALQNIRKKDALISEIITHLHEILLVCKRHEVTEKLDTIEYLDSVVSLHANKAMAAIATQICDRNHINFGDLKKCQSSN